jgi:hypothetical protein
MLIYPPGVCRGRQAGHHPAPARTAIFRLYGSGRLLPRLDSRLRVARALRGRLDGYSHDQLSVDQLSLPRAGGPHSARRAGSGPGAGGCSGMCVRPPRWPTDELPVRQRLSALSTLGAQDSGAGAGGSYGHFDRPSRFPTRDEVNHGRPKPPFPRRWLCALSTTPWVGARKGSPRRRQASRFG